MARCNCTSQGCQCKIEVGDGLVITGVGSAADPYVISNTPGSILDTFAAIDTTTVDLTLTGSGSQADPLILSAVATVAVTQLTDIIDPSPPASGDTILFDGTGWQFAPPPTTPPGAVNVGAGLTGDGSGPAPLKIAVSDLVTTSVNGLATYIDSTGKLRASEVTYAAIKNLPTYFPADWNTTVANKPSAFPAILGTTHTTAAFGDHKHSGADITSGVIPLARIPTMDIAHIPAPLAVANIPVIPGSKIQGGSLAGSAFSNPINLPGGYTINGAGTTTIDSNGTLTIWGQDADLRLGHDGVGARIWSETIRDRFYGGGAFPVVITTEGTLGRTASSRRYKTDIRAASDMPQVLEIEPRTWVDKANPDGGRRFGAIAEELDDLGLRALVLYGEDGQPEGIAYDRIAVALIPMLREMRSRIEALEAR